MTSGGNHTANDGQTPAPVKRKPEHSEKSFRKALAKEDWATALREAYPGMTDTQISKAAAEDLGADPRTVLYWLDGSTGPHLHHVMEFVAEHGMAAIASLFRNQLKKTQASK
jgi:hypothetical protein